jgi:hypothetical protein
MMLKNHCSNRADQRIPWIVAKISCHIREYKENPNSRVFFGFQVENHGKQQNLVVIKDKFTKGYLTYPHQRFQSAGVGGR